jgi:replicative DNA helicase
VSTSLEAVRPLAAIPHGRLPPQNLDAERSVLGGVLLDNAALNDVLEILKPEDFYREAHRKVFEAMCALSSRSEPIDRVTLKNELGALGAYEQVGGEDFIDLLDKIVPSASNLTYYGRIVHEKALARRVIEAAHAIASQGYEQHGDVGEFLDEAERRIFAITEAKAQTAFTHVRDIVKSTFKTIESLYERQEEITGIPTGFSDLDRLTSGFQPGDLVILAARPSMGKAQPLDAPVLTPAGYVPMGELRPGSLVIGRDGKAHRVTGVFPQGEKPVFRVRFSDGGAVECCDEHLWLTAVRGETGSGSVKQLSDIRRSLRVDGHPNHRVPTVAPVEFAPRAEPLLLAPYLMGLLLGDASFREATITFERAGRDLREKLSSHLPAQDTVSVDGITTRIRRRSSQPAEWMRSLFDAMLDATRAGCPPTVADLCRTLGHSKSNVVHDTLDRLREKNLVAWEGRDKRTLGLTREGEKQLEESLRRAESRRMSETRKALERYGLEAASGEEKFIPDGYLSGTVEERHDLLRGLLDAGGEIEGERIRFATTSSRLAEGVTWLVRSLGGLACSDGERMPVVLLLSFPSAVLPVSSKKHVARWTPGPVERFIEAVEPLGRKPCQCISVDSADHLYVTSDFAVTHNTAFCLNIATHVGCRAKFNSKRIGVGIFSLEMTKEQLVMRMLASEARVDSQRIRTGRLIESDWAKLAQAAGNLAEANIHIDDSPALSSLELRAKARRLAGRFSEADAPLGLVIIDYLQLMRGNERIDSREQQISEISRSLKALSKELNIPVLALSQLNRALEKRPDKRPLLSDLRESGSIEQDSDTVIFLYREEVYEKDKEEVKGVAEVIIGKQRNGPIGSATAAFLHEFTRFENLARDYASGGRE